MLKLLLDEHISPRVATGLRAKNRKIVVQAIAEWDSGIFLGQGDDVVLREAVSRGFTLVTYDQKTIPPLLRSWMEEERHHAGVIFVDDKTISPGNIGGLIRALTALVVDASSQDWRDRVVFIKR